MVAMMQRRTLLGSTMGTTTLAAGSSQPVTAAMAQNPIDHAPPEPLVWPALVKPPSGIRSFNGHTDTVLDLVGRIGPPPSLVIFTEGNHLMVLLGDDIFGAFPSWAKSQPQYADLDLDNIVVSTLPQPILVEAIRAGGITLGSLTLEVSRRSGLYPDIFMGYPEPLRQLHEQGVVESQARFFCRNRGVTLLVRKGNPLGIHSLSDVLRAGTRIALPDAGDVRAQCRAAADALLERSAANALFAAEVRSFPGRLGIMHRDLPEMVARSYADVAFTWHHLVSYWTRIFPNHFEAVSVAGGEPFFTEIALARAVDPLRVRALQAFDAFFFSRAQEVYPRYDFAPMDNNQFGKPLVLD
jgi:phage tail protein X